MCTLCGYTRMVSKTQLVILAAATGLTIWLFSRRYRKRKSSVPFTMEIQQVSPGSPIEEKAVLLDLRLVNSVTEILKALALQRQPSPILIAELQSLMSKLSADELVAVKDASDTISFGVSEWVFYHTLRVNKHIDWNPKTGIIDQTMTLEEKALGEKLAATIRKAYWANHLADLHAGKFDCLIDRLWELEERINGFRPVHSRRSIFDVALTQQQIDKKTFDVAFLTSLVNSAIEALEELESPAAHELTVNWFQNTFFNVGDKTVSELTVQALAFLFAQLDLLDSELANYRSAQLNLSSRRTKEREIFVNLVDQKTLQTLGIRAMLGSIESTPLAIFDQLKKYFLTPPSATCPMCETLLADTEQLAEFSRVILSVEIFSAFCVGVHSQVRALFVGVEQFLANEADMRAFLNECYSAILTEDAGSEELVDALVGELLGKVPSLRSVMTTAKIDKLKKGIGSCLAETAAVRVLYRRRVPELISGALVPGPPNKLATNSLGTSPWFLSVGVDKMNELVDKLTLFIAEHLNVYLPVYKEVLDGNLG